MSTRVAAGPLVYVPRALWRAPAAARTAGVATTWSVDGSLVLLDLVGFTPLTERHSRRGRLPTEELGLVIDRVFSEILSEALERGGDLVSFGGDALLLLFTGEHHTERAAATAVVMRDHIRASGASELRLRARLAVHTDPALDLVVAGDGHRDLFVTGPPVTCIVDLQKAARSGRVLVSDAVVARLHTPTILRDYTFGGTAPEVRPPRRPAELLVHVPVALRPYLGGTQIGEHRWVTVGALRFRGTDSARDQGPQRVADAIHEFLVHVQQACADEDVSYLKSDIAEDGGLTIITAGAPRSHTDDTPRLLRALKHVLAHPSRLRVAAGAARGLMFSGEIGPPSRRIYRVIGDAVNVAARLATTAPSGKLYVPDDLAESVGPTFAKRAVGELALKGKRSPMSVVSIGSPRAGRAPVTARPAFVGRRSELALLGDALERARRAYGSVIEIVGPGGSGKSRLLDAFAGRAPRGRGHVVVLRVVGDPSRAAQPYAAFVPAARAALGIASDADADAAGSALVAAAASASRELQTLLPLLAPLFDAAISASPEVDSLAPDFVSVARHRTFDQLLAASGASARVLLVEELPSLDGASRELVNFIAATARRSAWLVVVARRPSEPEGPAATSRIALEPLDDAACARLATDAASKPIDGRALASLMARAAGNPLFLIELARAWTVDTEGLPDTLETLLASRLDACDPDVRDFVRQAAILGTSFAADVALRTTGSADAAVIDRAIAAGVLESPRADELAFTHGLLRDAAYDGLAHRDRKELHGRARTILEQAGEPSAVLAPHALASGDHETAWLHATKAAEQARALYATADAIALCAIALRAAEHIPDLPGPEIAAVNETLGDLYELSGSNADARACYRRARSLENGTSAVLLRKEGELCERDGHYDRALRWYGRARRAVEAHGGSAAAALRAEIATAIAGVKYRQGRLRECVQWCERAIAEAEAAGGDRQLGHAYLTLAHAFGDLGDRRAEEYLRRAEAIFDALGDLVKLATVVNNFGVDAYYAGDWVTARDCYERAQQLFERAGDFVMAGAAVNNIGEMLSDQGRIPAARKQFADALERFSSANYPFGVALVTGNLGRAASRNGDFETAVRLLEDAREQFAQLGSRSFVIETEVRIAEAWLGAGRCDDALAALTALEPRAADEGATAFVRPLLWRLIAVGRQATGDEPGARNAFEQSCQSAEAVGSDYELACTLHAMAAPGSAESRAAAARLRTFGVRTRTAT